MRDIGNSVTLTGPRPFHPTSSLAILQHRASHSAFRVQGSERCHNFAPFAVEPAVLSAKAMLRLLSHNRCKGSDTCERQERRRRDSRFPFHLRSNKRKSFNWSELCGFLPCLKPVKRLSLKHLPNTQDDADNPCTNKYAPHERPTTFRDCLQKRPKLPSGCTCWRKLKCSAMENTWEK